MQSLLDYVKANNLDCIDIDDETWREKNSVTGGSNREPVTEFFRKLTKEFKAARGDYQVFWDSPPVVSAKDRFSQAWPDYRAIAEVIDGFCIMAYMLNPPTIGWTTSRQPVSGGGKAAGHPRDSTTCLKDYLEATGGRKEKLVLGVNIDQGGYEWPTKTDQPLAHILAKARPVTPEQARANAQKYGRRFELQQKEPWYCYRRGEGWVQGWYEDDEAFAAKLDLAQEQDIGGVCLWVLDGPNDPRSLFDLTAKYLQRK